jgi:nitrite reductase (NADH) small subunit
VKTELFDVGAVEDYPDGTHRVLEVGGRAIGVYHQDGSFYAALNVCPHALAPICLAGLTDTTVPSQPGQWVYGDGKYVLRCHWHGWEFDIRSGKTVLGIDRRRLVTYPVAVESGRVLVTMKPRDSVRVSDV